jgi:hypothetical protein
MIDLQQTLRILASKRPIFHSEADFQLALGMEIERQHPDAAVRLEYKPFPGERVHLDMWIYNDGRWMAVELKYKTRSVSVDWHGERFELVQQGAQDLSGYDIWKDVCRVERICCSFENVDGYAVVLSNDDSLWRRVSDTDTSVGAAFRVFDGRQASGTLYWASHAGAGTMKTREVPLTLGNDYELRWRDYARVGSRSGETLRTLVVPVQRPRPQVVAPLAALVAEAKQELRSARPARVQTRAGGRRSKYAPIGDYLASLKSDRVDLSYKQMEEMVGEPLPPSAHNHRAAWSNSSQNTWPMMNVVRRAGWKVDSVQMGNKVVFVRAKS